MRDRLMTPEELKVSREQAQELCGWPNGNSFTLTLLDQIDLLRQQAVWQPIDNAPKDGTRVLLYFPYTNPPTSIRTYIGSWYAYHHAEGWCMDGGYEAKITPTHWMPLPEPPKDSLTQPL